MRMELQGEAPSLYTMMSYLNLNYAGFGIGVMCVAPGAIKSGIGAANSERTILKPGSYDWPGIHA